MKYLAPILIVFFWISCKTKTASTSATHEEKKTETVSQNKSDTNNSRLVVLFYSIGEGADYKMIKAFEDSIGSYSHGYGKTTDYKKTAWGREGETDFCLRLNELTAKEQADFISRTRTLLKSAKWVNIYENYPCPARQRK